MGTTAPVEEWHLDEAFRGQGLVMQLAGKSQQAVLLIGGVGNYLPDWYGKPDQQQQLRLIEFGSRVRNVALA